MNEVEITKNMVSKLLLFW